MWADGYGIKMDGKETGCDHVSWIELVREHVRSWASLLDVLSLQSSPMSELVWHTLAHKNSVDNLIDIMQFSFLMTVEHYFCALRQIFLPVSGPNLFLYKTIRSGEC